MKSTNRFIGLFCSVILAILSVAVCKADLPPVRIMPLGDSVTQGYTVGSSVQGGYRNGLHTLLSNAGYVVDFVGTKNDDNNPSLPDTDHQGVPGYRIDDIRSQIGVWLKEIEDPDVILLEIGTNDFSAGAGVVQTGDRLKSLIASLSTSRPYAKIIVSTLPPRSDNSGFEASQVQFNAAIEGIVSEQVALGRQVTFVDIHSALGAGDLSDGVHPNSAGYQKMADSWFAAITGIISPLGTSNRPGIARVDSRSDLTHLKVKFSKPVDDSAADIAKFSLSGGVSVLQAELDSESKRVVTLTTSPQAPGTLYVLSVQGVYDRTPQQNATLPGTSREFTSRTLIDGSFESDGQGWQFSGNNLVVGSPLPATDGDKLVVFNGAEATPDGLAAQQIETIPGKKYKLNFDMGVNGTNAPQALNVNVSGNFDLISQTEQIAGPGGGTTQWVSKNFEFVANSPTTTVSFTDVSPTTNAVDLLLDDVTVNLEITPTLTVSSYPSAGVGITVSPVDLGSNGNGNTEFTRTYNENEVVSLTAPASFGGLNFEKWQKDGVDHSTSAATSVTMDAAHTMKACYSFLSNGSFELGNVAPDVNGFVDDVTSWTGSGHQRGYVAAGGYQATDLNRIMLFNSANTTPDGVIFQTFPTTPGQEYVLDYDLGVVGNSTGTQKFRVELNAVPSNDSLLLQTDSGNGTGGTANWSPKSHVFTATSTQTKLTFTDVSTETIGVDLLLDHVRVNLSLANTAPVAVDDSYNAIESTPLVVPAQGVLANDTDAQNDGLTAVINTNPAHGSVTLNANGGFTYTPTTNYVGPDSFTYHANDGALDSNIATVSITVSVPSTQLLVNGSFEDGPADGNGIVVDVDGWTEGGTGGRVGYIAQLPFTTTDLARLMVFNQGLTTPGGSISQTFTTTPGQAYLLEFDMGVLGSTGNQQKFAINLNGTSSLLSVTDTANGSGSAISTWTPKSHYFVADSTSTTLVFTDVSTAISNVDLLLDNVRVTSTSSRVLAVASSPATGASVTVTPTDLATAGDGVTSFTRGYSNATVVTLTAPATFSGNAFQKWTKNGVDLSTDPSANVTMDANYLLTAVYAGNSAPVAVSDSYATTVDVTLIVPAAGVLSNDTDADLDTLTASVVASPAHGTLTLNSDGGFTYIPAASYEGPDSFTYKANDGALDSNVVTVSINVQSATANLVAAGSFEAGTPAHVGTLDGWTVSAPPATGPFGYLADATIMATEGARLAVFNGGGHPFGASISQNLATTPGQLYRLSFDVGIAGATANSQQWLQIGVDGVIHDEQLTLTSPDGGASHWYPVTYTFVASSASTPLAFYDNAGALVFPASASGSDLLLDNVRVTIEVGNLAPVAVSDSHTTEKNVTLNVAAPGVLSNDTDNESDPLTAVLVAGPAHGTVTLNTDGSFEYIPTTDYVGSDSFTYKANDTNNDSNVATVSIDVTAPIVSLVTNGSFEVGSPTDFGSLDTWTVVESEPSAAVGYGSQGAYLLSDGARLALFNRGGKAFGSTISQVMTTEAGHAYQVDFDMGIVGAAGAHQSLKTTVVGSASLLSRTDSLTAVAGNAQWSPKSYTFVADGPTATLTFLDNTGSPGVGNAVNTDLLLDHVRVTEILNSRVLTVTSSPASSLAVTVSPADLGGNADGVTSFTRGYANGATVTLTATAASGANVFQKWQKDGFDITTDLSTEVEMDADYTLNAVYVVDNSPRAYADAYATVEETLLTVAAPGVLTNDVEPNSLGMTAVLDTTTANGTLNLASDGSFTYLPVVDFSGPDTFTYHASNGTLSSSPVTVTITVNPVNDPPSAQPLSIETNEDTAVAATLVGIDPDGDSLTYVIDQAPTKGLLSGTAPNLTYTPDPNINGPDSFTFTVNDGSGPSAPATVSINIVAVADPPVADSQNLQMTAGTSLPVTLTGSDADDDEITFQLVVSPTHGTVSGTPPNVVYTPVSNYVGTDSFTFRAYDGTDYSTEATVSITVDAVLKNPSFELVSGSPSKPDFWTYSGNFAVNTGTGSLPSTHPTTTSKYISFNDGNVAATAVLSQTFATTPGQPYDLLFSQGAFGAAFQHRMRVILTGSTQIKSQDFAITGPGGTGHLWTEKSTSFIANSATTTLQFLDVPVSSAVGNNSDMLLDNVRLQPQLTRVLMVNSSPVPGVNVTVSPADFGSNGNGVTSFSRIYADSAVVSLAAPAVIGAQNFQKWQRNGVDFAMTPATSVTMDASYTLTALYVPNEAPVAVSDAFTANEDVELAVLPANGVLSNDNDPESASLTAVLDTTTTHGTLTLSPDGGFTYLSDLNYSGTDEFTYHASDGVVDSGVVTVTIMINPVNDAPVALADTASTDEDTALTVAAPGVLGNDSDVEGDTLTAVLDTPPASGSLTLNGDGSYEFIPAANSTGDVTFSYHAEDATDSSSIVTVTITINPINDAPVALADTASTDEDTTLAVAAPGVLGNDSDVEGDTLTAMLDTPPASGSLTLNTDGSYEFIPAANSTGDVTFSYHAEDATTSSSIVTVTITINPINDAPVALADTASTDEDTTLAVAAPGVLGNDSDVEGDTLTAVLDTPPASGSLTLNTDGSYEFIPAANSTGDVTFSYHAEDATTSSSIVTVTITVNPINDAPVALADTASTDEDTTLTVAAPGVLGNDSDVDGDTLTAVLDTPPASGSLTLNTDGSYEFIPAANSTGDVTFSYHAEDATTSSSIVTVTITINPVNDAPVALADTASTDEDTTLTVAAPGVLGNDSDVEGDTLTAVLDTPPASGSLTLNTDGSYEFIPAANSTGDVTFSYHAEDATTSSSIVTVTITVNPINDAPVALADTASTDEDTTLTVAAPGVLGNDSDVDGDTLTAVLDTPPASGSLTLNTDGSYEFIPAANSTGDVTFSYHAEDATTSSSIVTVTITVNPINDAPVALADTASTDEDTTLTVAAPGVLGNDNDVEGDTLTAVLDTPPASGSLTLNTDGSYEFIPAANITGDVTFSYHAEDATTSSSIVTVTITINPVNDAPVALADTASTDEDTTLTVSAPGVLGNDSDVEGDTLTAVLDTPPASGSLTLNTDGSYEFIPAANSTGDVTFSYHAEDATTSSSIVTVTITINPVNDAPVALADTASTDEDTTLTVAAPGVLGNDSDVDGDTLTAVLDTPPASGSLTLNTDGSYEFIPAANSTGDVTFSYHAEDATTSSSIVTVTITVNPINDAPVALADLASTDEDTTLTVAAPGVLGNDSDVEGDTLTAVLDTPPASGSLTLNTDGSYEFIPATNSTGDVTFSYHAEDATTSSSIVTVTIMVNPINDAPVALADTASTDEDTTLTVAAPGVLGNDSDVEGDTLTAVLDTPPASGSLTLNTDGSYEFIPAANSTGDVTFSYHAEDATTSSSIVTVTITINPINDAPVALADTASTDEDTTLTVAAPGVLGNDSDVEGDTLTAVLDTPPASGSLTLNTDGSYEFIPAANSTGDVTFSYHAEDATTSSSIVTVTITINPINDAPVALADTASTDEDTTLTVAAPGVLGNDSDVEGDTLTAVLDTPPVSGSLTLNTDGSYEFIPAANSTGDVTFSYHAEDATTSSSIVTVTITVNPINDAPVALADTASTDEDTTLTVAAPGVLGNDSDVEGDTLTAVLDTPPASGSLTLNPDGSYEFIPAANSTGDVTFSYHVEDATTSSSIVTVTITINPINDAPVALADLASTDEDTTLTVSAPGVLGNDSDVEGDTLTAVLDTPPASGSLTLNTDGSYEFIPANSTGDVTFSYHAEDATDSSSIVTVTITINPVNDAPVALADTASTDEDTTLTVAAPGVLGNDNDVEGDTLTAVLDTPPASGSLTLNTDGSYEFIPATNSTGDVTFSYHAEDATTSSSIVTVTITVNPINDAPVALADTASTDEDTTLTVAAPGVLGNDSDVEGDTLTAVLDTPPASGSLTLNTDGSYEFIPAANSTGDVTFSYHAEDATDSSSIVTVTITINPINDAPVALADTASTDEDTTLTVAAPGVLGNDNDVEGDTLTAVLDTPPASGSLTLNTDGSYEFIPAANSTGDVTFSYHAEDATTSSSIVTVTITVNPINDAPVALADLASTDEDTTLTVAAPGVLGNDSDVDGDTLTAVLDTPPASGSLTLNTDGSYEFIPAANSTGDVTFSYHAEDATTSSSIVTVTITINPVNDAPVAWPTWPRPTRTRPSRWRHRECWATTAMSMATR